MPDYNYFCALFFQEEKELGEKRAAELTHLTGLFILRRTQEVINKFLPPKKESIIFCRPTVLQLELYRKLLSSRVITSCLQGRLENSPHLICIGALKKLCNHPCLLFKAIKVSVCKGVCACDQSFRQTQVTKTVLSMCMLLKVISILSHTTFSRKSAFKSTSVRKSECTQERYLTSFLLPYGVFSFLMQFPS